MASQHLQQSRSERMQAESCIPLPLRGTARKACSHGNLRTHDSCGKCDVSECRRVEKGIARQPPVISGQSISLLSLSVVASQTLRLLRRRPEGTLASRRATLQERTWGLTGVGRGSLAAGQGSQADQTRTFLERFQKKYNSQAKCLWRTGDARSQSDAAAPLAESRSQRFCGRTVEW
jgi:hypothetical protein